MSVFFKLRDPWTAMGCLFLCVSAGCNNSAPPPSPETLPTAPQPADGSGSVEVNQGKPAIASLDFAVKGSFALEDEERNPAPLHVRILRSGDPLSIVQNSVITRAVRDGERWNFDCKIGAPGEPGDYEVIVYTDKYEIARGKISVIPK